MERLASGLLRARVLLLGYVSWGDLVNILQLERKIRILMIRAYLRGDYDHMDELWEIHQEWFPGEYLVMHVHEP